MQWIHIFCSICKNERGDRFCAETAKIFYFLCKSFSLCLLFSYNTVVDFVIHIFLSGE